MEQEMPTGLTISQQEFSDWFTKEINAYHIEDHDIEQKIAEAIKNIYRPIYVLKINKELSANIFYLLSKALSDDKNLFGQVVTLNIVHKLSKDGALLPNIRKMISPKSIINAMLKLQDTALTAKYEDEGFALLDTLLTSADVANQYIHDVKEIIPLLLSKILRNLKGNVSKGVTNGIEHTPDLDLEKMRLITLLLGDAECKELIISQGFISALEIELNEYDIYRPLKALYPTGVASDNADSSFKNVSIYAQYFFTLITIYSNDEESKLKAIRAMSMLKAVDEIFGKLLLTSEQEREYITNLILQINLENPVDQECSVLLLAGDNQLVAKHKDLFFTLESMPALEDLLYKKDISLFSRTCAALILNILLSDVSNDPEKEKLKRKTSIELGRYLQEFSKDIKEKDKDIIIKYLNAKQYTREELSLILMPSFPDKLLKINLIFSILLQDGISHFEKECLAKFLLGYMNAYNIEDSASIRISIWYILIASILQKDKDISLITLEPALEHLNSKVASECFESLTYEGFQNKNYGKNEFNLRKAFLYRLIQGKKIGMEKVKEEINDWLKDNYEEILNEKAFNDIKYVLEKIKKQKWVNNSLLDEFGSIYNAEILSKENIKYVIQEIIRLCQEVEKITRDYGYSMFKIIASNEKTLDFFQDLSAYNILLDKKELYIAQAHHHISESSDEYQEIELIQKLAGIINDYIPGGATRFSEYGAVSRGILEKLKKLISNEYSLAWSGDAVTILSFLYRMRPLKVHIPFSGAGIDLVDIIPQIRRVMLSKENKHPLISVNAALLILAICRIKENKENAVEQEVLECILNYFHDPRSEPDRLPNFILTLMDRIYSKEDILLIERTQSPAASKLLMMLAKPPEQEDIKIDVLDCLLRLSQSDRKNVYFQNGVESSLISSIERYQPVEQVKILLIMLNLAAVENILDHQKDFIKVLAKASFLEKTQIISSLFSIPGLKDYIKQSAEITKIVMDMLYVQYGEGEIEAIQQFSYGSSINKENCLYDLLMTTVVGKEWCFQYELNKQSQLVLENSKNSESEKARMLLYRVRTLSMSCLNVGPDCVSYDFSSKSHLFSIKAKMDLSSLMRAIKRKFPGIQSKIENKAGSISVLQISNKKMGPLVLLFKDPDFLRDLDNLDKNTTKPVLPKKQESITPSKAEEKSVLLELTEEQQIEWKNFLHAAFCHVGFIRIDWIKENGCFVINKESDLQVNSIWQVKRGKKSNYYGINEEIYQEIMLSRFNNFCEKLSEAGVLHKTNLNESIVIRPGLEEIPHHARAVLKEHIDYLLTDLIPLAESLPSLEGVEQISEQENAQPVYVEEIEPNSEINQLEARIRFFLAKLIGREQPVNEQILTISRPKNFDKLKGRILLEFNIAGAPQLEKYDVEKLLPTLVAVLNKTFGYRVLGDPREAINKPGYTTLLCFKDSIIRLLNHIDVHPHFMDSLSKAITEKAEKVVIPDIESFEKEISSFKIPAKSTPIQSLFFLPSEKYAEELYAGLRRIFTETHGKEDNERMKNLRKNIRYHLTFLQQISTVNASGRNEVKYVCQHAYLTHALRLLQCLRSYMSNNKAQGILSRLRHLIRHGSSQLNLQDFIVDLDTFILLLSKLLRHIETSFAQQTSFDFSAINELISSLVDKYGLLREDKIKSFLSDEQRKECETALSVLKDQSSFLTDQSFLLAICRDAELWLRCVISRPGGDNRESYQMMGHEGFCEPYIDFADQLLQKTRIEDEEKTLRPAI